jgi:hypothetical protein
MPSFFVTGRHSEVGPKLLSALLKIDPEPVAGSKTGMEVWKLHAEPGKQNVVLRKSVRDFWERLNAELQNEKLRSRNRVVVGSPGIGKSSTHPYLLRLLLKTGRPVVFLERGKYREGKYYEFRPNGDSSYEALEYREKDVDEDTIPALKNPSAVLLIEPLGNRTPPNEWIKAIIVLVCSPNLEHYKGMEKSGEQQFDASFRYFPHWSSEEIHEARPYMQTKQGQNEKSAEEVEADLDDDIWCLGNFPRGLFSEDRGKYDEKQNVALNNLSEEQVKRIMGSLGSGSRKLDIDGSSSSSPSSALVEYHAEAPFVSRTLELVSGRVASEIWSRYEQLLLRSVLYEVPAKARYCFEEYCRMLLAKKEGATFTIRSRDGIKNSTLPYPYIPRLNDVKWRMKVIDGKLQDVDLQPRTLYTARSDYQEFVDALAKREDGGVDGFQFSLGSTHTCNPSTLELFASKLGTSERPFRLYYMVPEAHFAEFKISSTMCRVNNAEVYILSCGSEQLSKFAALDTST